MIYLINISLFTDDFYGKIKTAEEKIFKSTKITKENKLSTYGRVLLGFALQTGYGIDSYSYRFGRRGKPYIKGEDVFFSISHSGSYVVCCVSDSEVGCDIEKIKEYNPKVAKRFFTEAEVQLIEKSDDKDSLFVRLWTLKESILKKHGTGISGGLATYDFADYAFFNEFFAYECNFISHSLDGYEFPICSEKKHFSSEIIELSLEELEKYIDRLNYKNS